MNILITGAAGNLGTLLSAYILDHEKDLKLILMKHKKDISVDIRNHDQVTVRQADLSRPETLDECIDGSDVIVHFAGVLFKAKPERFLYQTNIRYFENLVQAAAKKGINKIILISFPHVEGPTSRNKPATGRLDGTPISVHAQTRLEEEKLLFERIKHPVSLRVGMVYGKGILMVDAAKWFSRIRLLGVWKEPTEIHLISKTDFCRATVAAIKNENATGIYHVGDEGNDTLQSFLDLACDAWGYQRPWRMPLWLIYLTARTFELASTVFGTKSILTKDFIDIGRVSYYGETSRFREQLLPELIHRDVNAGLNEFNL